MDLNAFYHVGCQGVLDGSKGTPKWFLGYSVWSYAVA